MIDLEIYRQARIEHWDEVAERKNLASDGAKYYHQRLTEVYRFLVAPGQKVLELGCGYGDLIASLKPSLGVGVDFSPKTISTAKQRHSDLTFICADVHDFDMDRQFDVIIVSDLVNDLWDVQGVFQKCAKLACPHTRLILNGYSRLWELPLTIAQRLDLAYPVLDQNWLTVSDIADILYLAEFEVLRSWPEILWPLRTPIIDTIVNHGLVKLWPFRMLALTNFVVARPFPSGEAQPGEPSVSIIIPARNEAGNIPQVLARVPQMGSFTELVFVEGHSRDDTYSVIEQCIADHPEIKCQLLCQEGVGKGDAVRLGFAKAKGDILMILDCDMTVPPEDLPRFYEALVSGKGEFINGVRLVYPMQRRAMRFLNLIGNKFFSLAFSWLLGQPIKDTLCGTKVLWKKDYESIVANRGYFGNFDPFGDFDLLFGAAKLNLKILDLPIRYRERTYGTTNIQRWKHGWLLLRMVLFAAMRLKFV